MTHTYKARHRGYRPGRRVYKPGRRPALRLRPQPQLGWRPERRFPTACAPEGAYPFGPSG